MMKEGPKRYWKEKVPINERKFQRNLKTCVEFDSLPHSKLWQ